MSEWTHLEDTRPKARKRHQCLLCYGHVEPGETYVRRSGIGEDGPESFCMHAECEEVSMGWDVWDWEVFEPGTLERPNKGDS